MRFFDFIFNLFRKKTVVETVALIDFPAPIPIREEQSHECLMAIALEKLLDEMEQKRINREWYREQFIPRNITYDEEDHFYLQ
jgi:hypothetical protein